MLKLKAGHKVYFKGKANTFADLLGFGQFDLTKPANTSARIVDLVKDLLIFVSVDCLEGSSYNIK